MNIELFKKYNNQGKYLEAYLIIKNMFNKDLANQAVFHEFFELGLKLASFDIDFSERKNYLNEVSNALALFSDNAELDDDVIEYLKECNTRISNVYYVILHNEKMDKEVKWEVIRGNNNKLINQLGDVLDDLKSIKTQNELDILLEKINDIEVRIDKNSFNEGQEQSYQLLSKNFSNIIAKKMEEINNRELLDMNRKAIVVFKNVFEKYISKKDSYKDNEANLKALVYNSLFAFDSRDLFNETLVYYNHIYSMIFNEVSDKLKFKLTEWSIEATKNR